MKSGLVFVLIGSLLGCGECKNQSYFRAKFNNKKVENHIKNFEYWGEIQSQEVDVAFETYQKGPYIQKRFPDEAALIFKVIERGGLLGVAAEAHEKWEVLEYIRRGYSTEEIGNGKAYEEYKPAAHAEARFRELRLYQFWYKQVFNEKPPAMRAFLFVHPVLKIIVEDIYKVEVDDKLMRYLLDELEKYKDVVGSENCSKEDVGNCIKFFETTGFSYGDERDLFLRRGLHFADKF